jgi:hypothetical protein
VFFIGGLILVFLVFLWLRIYNKQAFYGEILIDFPAFIGLGWLLYAVFPLLEVAVRGDGASLDEAFLMECLIALLSLIGGSLAASCFIREKHVVPRRDRGTVRLSSLRQENRPPVSPRQVNHEKLIVIGMSLLCAGFLSHYVNRLYGGWVLYFTQRYTSNFILSEFNSLNVSIPLYMVSYILVLNHKSLITTKGARSIVFLMSLALILVFMFGGNRNLGAMMGIALIWACSSGKKINLYLFLPFLLLGVLGVGLIAVGREYGVINFLRGDAAVPKEDVVKYIFSINDGEFGTMKRFQQYAAEREFELPRGFGYTYTIGAMINLIPTILFPSRPLAVSDAYSQYMLGIYSTEGLGFSPIYEAKLNFYGAWFIAFFSAGFLMRIFCGNSHGKAAESGATNLTVGYLFLGSASAVSLNLFRIDFAVVLKFVLLIMAFSYLIKHLVLLGSKVKLSL